MKQARERIKGCLTIQAAYRDFLSPLTGDIDGISQNSLTDDLKEQLTKLNIAELSEPVEEEDGFSLYMVCRRLYINNNTMPSRAEVSDKMVADQLNLLQQQYLQSLRKESFIDIRLF